MREERMFVKPSAVDISAEEAREIILYLQECYKKKKLKHRLYNEEDFVPENIISMYLYYTKHTDYEIIVNNYKKQFIRNESLVEPGVTKAEREGLGIIYDYISTYDFKGDINIFVEGLKLHAFLYAKCPFPEFGGTLRVDPAILKDAVYDVPDAATARRMFQDYLTKKFCIDYDNIFDYIDEAIRVTIDLIKIQPFPDGNKRTFRALLNLLLGKIGIPPVYIKMSERAVYKEELLKAIEQEDYFGITRFYYYKICDSIVELDLMNISKQKEAEHKVFVIKPIN